MAHSDALMELVGRKVKFLGDIIVLPGENELESLAAGALRVLHGEERAKLYPTGEYA